MSSSSHSDSHHLVVKLNEFDRQRGFCLSGADSTLSLAGGSLCFLVYVAKGQINE